VASLLDLIDVGCRLLFELVTIDARNQSDVSNRLFDKVNLKLRVSVHQLNVHGAHLLKLPSTNVIRMLGCSIEVL
jgi:hypothetical protein